MPSGTCSLTLRSSGLQVTVTLERLNTSFSTYSKMKEAINVFLWDKGRSCQILIANQLTMSGTGTFWSMRKHTNGENHLNGSRMVKRACQKQISIHSWPQNSWDRQSLQAVRFQGTDSCVLYYFISIGKNTFFQFFNQGAHYVTPNLVFWGLKIFPGENIGFSVRCCIIIFHVFLFSLVIHFLLHPFQVLIPFWKFLITMCISTFTFQFARSIYPTTNWYKQTWLIIKVRI